jgi:hypothetical protein
MAEFLVVEVGGQAVKDGMPLTILAVTDSVEAAETKAATVESRSPYVAILETKGLLLRRPKIELERLRITLVEGGGSAGKEGGT